MTAIFDALQVGYNAIGAKKDSIFQGPLKADYVPEDHIWAHYMKGLLVGYERRQCAPRKMQAVFCEEINQPTETPTIVGKHRMFDSKGRNTKCLKYHDSFIQCQAHATREIEFKCSDPWVQFQQSLMKESQKKASQRGTPEEWYNAGIDMYLRIPKTRSEKMGPRYAPGMVTPKYVPQKPVGESLGDTFGKEVAKQFRLLSVCLLAKDSYAHLRDEQIKMKEVLPTSSFDAQQTMLEGRGGKEKIADVLLELRKEKTEALKKGEHWGKREYKTWHDVAEFPQAYTQEIYERRRLENHEGSEFTP